MDSVNGRNAVAVASFEELESMTVAANGVDMGNAAGTGMVNEGEDIGENIEEGIEEDIGEDIVGGPTRGGGFLFLTLVAHRYVPVACVWGPLASYGCQVHYKVKEAPRVRGIAGTSKVDSSPLDLELPLV